MKFRYMALVFLGGCSYGTLATYAKLAFAEGFLVSEVIGAQNFFGWFMLLCLMLIFARYRLSLKTALLLMVVGLPTGLTSIMYNGALQTIPASLAIIFLFQFTWIGIFLEAIVDRRWPSREKWLSIPFLLIGTLLAGGIFNGESLKLDPTGTILASLSAISFALFIFFNGRIATHIPAISRSFWMVTGGIILITLVYPPRLFINGALGEGLLKYALVLGFFGMVIPPLFFAKGVPKVGPGIASILSASELPTAICMAMFILHEPVTYGQWSGVILILLGIASPQLLLLWKKNRLAISSPKVEN